MSSPLRSRLKTLLFLTGAFLLAAVFFTTQNLFYSQLKPEDYRITLRQEFLLYIVRWLPWVLCAPFVLWLSRRFPVRGRRWASSLAVLVPASVAVSAVQSSLCAVLYRWPFAGWVGLPASVGRYLADPWLTSLNQIHINIVTFLVILLAAWGLDALRLYKEKEAAAGRLEAELARANLQALKSQVHPHFLFNTLHMISAMVYEDPPKADLMISRLSDLLRATLESTDAPTAPLRDELEILSLYLDIMEARFGDRLRVDFDVVPETLDALVPSFGLQPLVENAIKHGIMPRNEGGTVVIAARRDEGRLVVGVSDDGPGLRAAPDELLGTGVGLRNLKSRVLGLYGDDGSVRLGNGSGGGGRVELDIPFRVREA